MHSFPVQYSTVKHECVCVRGMGKARGRERCCSLIAVQVRKKIRCSAYHALCLYWSALVLAVMLLGQQIEDMLIWLSTCEGSQKRSERLKMALHKRTYWFSIWRLCEFLDDKSKDKKGGGGAANIESCQTRALHQVTGAGGTTVTWRMMTDGGERWWEPCPVWRASLLSSLLSSSVPHSTPPSSPSLSTTSALPSCISSVSFSSDFPKQHNPGLKDLNHFLMYQLYRSLVLEQLCRGPEGTEEGGEEGGENCPSHRWSICSFYWRPLQGVPSRRAMSIIKGSHHHAHSLFALLPSGRHYKSLSSLPAELCPPTPHPTLHIHTRTLTL